MSIENTEDNKAEEGKKKVTKPKRTSNDIINAHVKRSAKSKSAKTTQVDLNWYIVQVLSNQEQRAKESLRERVNKNGLEDYFGEIKIPQEEMTELIKGNKQTVKKKFFPGYILVEMKLTEDTWHLIKDTPKLIGFVGDESNPLPMSEEEVERLLQQMQDGSAALAATNTFEIGDKVEIVEGPFAGHSGTVEDVKPEKEKLRVLILVFGRGTPVELGMIQVTKAS